MSGGSWNYLYREIENAADRLQNSDNGYRRLLGMHLYDVAHALHDIEWVDSCDYGEGDEVEAIKKVLLVTTAFLVKGVWNE